LFRERDRGTQAAVSEEEMEQHEIDKLISDIQDYLDRAGRQRETEGLEGATEVEREELQAGFFTSAGSRAKMQRFLKLSRFAAYAVEILTIALFTTGVLIPFRSRAGTLMFLLAVLLVGVFTVTVLHGLRTRIHLLMRIESNTRRIALAKARIAEALGQIQMK
jgi:hypothetical protein